MTRSKGGIFVILILCVAAAILIVAPFVTYRNSEQVVVAKVIKTESVTRNDTHKFLVFTDRETFEVTDSISFMRFNSADVYGQIQVGKSYRFRVAGWRSPALSQFRNIIEASLVP